MDVRVKLFATYREIAGLQETTVELPEGATAADLVQRILEAHPRLAPHRSSMILAVNQEFAEPGARLHPNDEVALLPPVSGGGSSLCRLQTERINPESLLELVHDPRAGATVLFVGTVRGDPGVGALDYEAYEGMALKQMESLRTATKGRFEVTEIAIVHRTGRLPVGEVAVAVACSAPHRQAAFDACAWAMEELKQVVPVWKTERE